MQRALGFHLRRSLFILAGTLYAVVCKIVMCGAAALLS